MPAVLQRIGLAGADAVLTVFDIITPTYRTNVKLNTKTMNRMNFMTVQMYYEAERVRSDWEGVV